MAKLALLPRSRLDRGRMATSETIRAVERPDSFGAMMSDDGFSVLHERLLSVMSRLQCVIGSLNYEVLENELHPAAYVLRETTDEVIRLYTDLQDWHMHHKHTPKEVQS